MLHNLLNAFAEMLLSAIGDAVLKFLGWEQAAEFVTALVGLTLIVTGFAIWWTGG